MILLILLVPALVLSLWYLVTIVALLRGLGRIRRVGEPAGMRFSVVIAARDEESGIGECLESVCNQAIDRNRYEVIVVDDRSTDNTADTVRQFAQRYPNLSLVQVEQAPEGVSPKKNAMLKGIAHARYETLACTDADCRVPPTWLETLDCSFGPATGFVQGVTTYYRPPRMNRFFYSLQALDFLSHDIVAAGAIGAGLPLNANGNNLAFRKEAFVAVGGYGQTRSVLLGDDDLLMQRVWRHPDWDVHFMGDTKGTVETRPKETFWGVLEQRRRWGSVAVHYGPIQVMVLSGVFLFYCAILASLVACFWNVLLLPLFADLYAVKFIGELLLMIPGARMMRRTDLLPSLLPLSLLHLPLVVLSVLGGVLGRLNWKGQRVRRTV